MSNKYTIGISANSSWNIINFRLGLMKFLRAKGYIVIAIAPNDEATKKIIKEGFQFAAVKNLKRKGTNPIDEIRLVNEYRNIFQSNSLDFLFSYTIKPNIYGSIAAGRLGLPNFCTVTGLGYSFLSRGIVNVIAKKLYKYSFSKATKIFFQNQDDLNLFVDLKLAHQGKCGLVRGSGIDANYFAPRVKIKKEKGLKFLFIGRLLKDKGVRELREAFSLLSEKNPSIELHLLGALDNQNPAAITKAFLNEWCKKNRVFYHGVTKDTRPFINESDVIVLPSYREGLPRVNLEAMSMKKPVITTNVPGCKDTVTDGYNGYLCEVKNAISLYETMLKFTTLSEERISKMGQNGRQRVLDFFSQEIISQFYLQELKKQTLLLSSYEPK